MYLTLGSDPEFLCLKDKKPVFSYKFLNGDRDILLPKGCLYPDGYAAEMKIKPGYNYKEVSYYIDENMRYILENIGEVSYDPVVDITKEDIELSKDYGRGRLDVFGCRKESPLYSNHIENINPLEVMYRTFGGHIHIGFNEYPILDDFTAIQKLVSLLDSTVGLLSVVKNPGESFKKRKSLYGKAGYHRVYQTEGSHVIEYRVLPSVSVLKDSALYFQIAELVAYYLYDIRKEEDFFSLFGGMNGFLQRAEIINNHDPILALEEMKNFCTYIPGLEEIIRENLSA